MTLQGNQDIDGLAGFMIELMERLGLVGAAIAVGLDNIFPPIPSEIVLPMAGLAASQGTFTYAGALFATTAGSVIGAFVMYWIGRGFGRDRTEWMFAVTPLLRISDLEKSEAWFAKHGPKAVFFGRMVPIFRSVISIPAGVEKMNQVSFLLLTTLGSLIWNSIFVTAGFTLGENWHVIEPYADWFQRLVILAVLGVMAVFVFVRIRERQDPRER
uniref:Putative membrane-associated protein n=1 Tax=uncultured bacterium A1Q1_fos_324 TaxID=1256572 RepID=L7VUX7_9BACT|nr:putative membrane-associated protein [uncultured bacterium A1Q1_fos_324]